MDDATDADAVLATDAGAWLVWQPEAFAYVQDYEAWSAELEEASDLLRQVTAGVAVPITIGSDGAYSFRVPVGQQVDLAERERLYLLVSSDPYLLVSHGRVVVSGIEHVGGPDPIRHLAVDVPPGRWAVTAHVIAWDDEPGVKDEAGRPAAQALPDFVVLLNANKGRCRTAGHLRPSTRPSAVTRWLRRPRRTVPQRRELSSLTPPETEAAGITFA